MSGVIYQRDSSGRITSVVEVKKKSTFMRRELPTIIAIGSLLALWVGLVAH